MLVWCLKLIGHVSGGRHFAGVTGTLAAATLTGAGEARAKKQLEIDGETVEVGPEHYPMYLSKPNCPVSPPLFHPQHH